jgi:hypothetical protein
MMREHHDMLSYVLDALKGTEQFIPLGDHTVFQKNWFAENYSLFWDSLQETEWSETKKKKAKHVFHLVTDAYTLFLKEAENPTWQTSSLEERASRIDFLKKSPQIEQRSEEWYSHFAKCLTASEFSSLFGSARKRNELILAKSNPRREDRGSIRLACPTDEMTPFGWGIRFEPVVKQILEYKDSCKVFDLGRITHPNNPKLAASPDGIIESSPHKHQVGRLIEIKCPYTRQIGFEIPFDYWVQMQIQMEVTNIDECEYIEVELESARPNRVTDLSGCSIQGTLYLLKQIVKEDEPFEYKYLYGEIGSSIPPSVPDGYEIQETIPWGMRKWHRKVVHRDRAWYISTKSWQDLFWFDVERVKDGETLSIPTIVKQQECLIQDSD